MSGVLESYASSKSEKELTSLLKLAPETALLLKDDIETEVEVSTLDVGDIVIVKVGQQVPVDGIIIKGMTSINQAAITGEFVPVSKDVGSLVFAGSMNIESTIIVKANKNPKDSVVQKIIDFVEDAQENKTKTQTFIDKFEKYYVYIVILISIVLMTLPSSMGWWTWSYAFNRGIIVLVVGSPCALVASTTPAMLSALSNGARHRILIKGGNPLEAMNGIDSIILDKTGTITSGIPQVINIEVVEGYDTLFIHSLLLTLEKQSDHPLARAIAKHLSPTTTFMDILTNEVPGRGMEATLNGDLWQIGRFNHDIHPLIKTNLDTCNQRGHSNVPIIKNGELIGFVALSDTLRPNVKSVIHELKVLGINPILLTGDHELTASSIANDIGIEQYVGDCFPEDKVHFIEELQKNGHKVMMVGDGINDAPALAVANVKIGRAHV